MITATANIDGPPFTFNAEVGGLAVYLDNWSLMDLAEGDVSRRKRFIDSLRAGGDLLFSVTNAAELAGPQGKSLDDVRMFLDELGARWFPVRLDANEVVRLELEGASPSDSCISVDFLKQYFKTRMAGYPTGKIVSLSDDFFGLGAVLDWVTPQRNSIREGSVSLDSELVKKVAAHRAEFERNPSWLEEKFPVLQFNPSKPATFAYINLVRALILERNPPLKKGDGFDFCHAVLASAFASVATLDKHWKRRVEALPKPNKLAKIYDSPLLDVMVTDIEGWQTGSTA